MANPGRSTSPKQRTAYFRTNPARYGAIKPIANSLLAEHDVLGELTSQRAMTVMSGSCCRKYTTGMAHPQAVVRRRLGGRFTTISAPRRPRPAPMRPNSPATSPTAIRLRASPWKHRALRPTRMATTTSSLCSVPTFGWRTCWGSAFATTVSPQPRPRASMPAGSRRRLRAISRPISTATSTLRPIWPRPSGVPISSPTATSAAISTSAAVW